MAVDERLWRALDKLSETRSLLVACAFDGALAFDEGDPDAARAEEHSSEAINVLIALPSTKVAVVSERPHDQVEELMFLSGVKGGVLVTDLAGLPAMRDELGATAIFAVGIDPGADATPADVVVAVDAEGPYEVDDVDDVSVILGELAGLRRGW